jgi:predicted porin
MTTDANNDKGTGGSKNGKGGRNNPVIISSDLTNAQNLDRSYTGIINVGMSQSSMTGTSSWGVNSMIWFNFRQFALTGRYTKIHYSKSHKLKLIHNFNLTGVYSYGNILGFLGYSAILNAGKFGITGINVSGAVTKTPDDVNLFMSPSATAFYTKPFKVGKRMILSPELYVISTPLIYSSVDKVSVSDRTFSAFIGTGVDYQISKRFKVNMNYKLNMSTNPDFPILSFFLIGSKVNL